ncbi:alpha/beta hydrolase [Croceibacterium salegens]|nr:alpha/beta hydrolase [Croceibacterium salegens]
MPDVTVYVVNAAKGGARPGILHTHGGGHILGSAKSELRYLQNLARDLDCVLVTVEYRLAPETRYTGSIEDNYAALKWMHSSANELGLDATRIALLGESAGGTHAALLAITARDRGEVPVLFQCLVYPMLDDRTGSTRQLPPWIGAVLWTRDANRFGWRAFTGGEPGTLEIPAAAVPARVDNLAGLPPAWIGVGGADLFVEEDIEYAERLNDAAVPTELLVLPRAFHAFDRIVPDAGVSRRFTAAKMDALRRAFGKSADA